MIKTYNIIPEDISARDIFTKSFLLRATLFILLLLSFLFCGILIGQERGITIAKNYIYETLTEHCPEVLMQEGIVHPDDEYISIYLQRQSNRSQANKTEYGWEVK